MALQAFLPEGAQFGLFGCLRRMLEHKSFTRQQFYELVWSKPMIKLAEELGVSDVALRKLCLKHKISWPPQGECVSN